MSTPADEYLGVLRFCWLLVHPSLAKYGILGVVHAELGDGRIRLSLVY